LDAAFRRRIQKVQHEIAERTTGTLTAAATEAVKTLVELLKTPRRHPSGSERHDGCWKWV
jgi:hypothetical protein